MIAALLLTLAMTTGKATAATVSYDLTGDPKLGVWSGVSLARVTLTDTGSGVDFNVEALVPGTRLDSFGFNFLNDIQPGSFAISSLPTDWLYGVAINSSTGFNGFGKFDVAVYNGNGQASRVSPLTFSVSGGSIANYVALTNKDSYFSAHVTDLDTRGPDYGSCSVTDVANEICTVVTGYAGGGTLVPVPAAVWLFGSGLLGLIGISRRKKAV